MHALGRLTVGDGDRSLRHLQQHGQLLPSGRRVRDDHLAAIDGVNDELVGDVLVDLLAVFLTLSVAVLEEVLSDQDRHLVRARLRRFDLFMEDDHRAAGRERHLRSLEFRFMLRRLERQIEHRQREHHLREVAARIGDVRAEERLRRIMLSVVAPERVDRDEAGVLLGDGEVVVVVLRPFLGRVHLAVELTDGSEVAQISEVRGHGNLRHVFI